MLDIFFALGLAGCVYGLARAMGKHPSFRSVAWWTVAVMFGIAAYTELSLVRSGEATPNVGHVLPFVVLGIALYLAGRAVEWFARRRGAVALESEAAESPAETPELQAAG